MEEVQALKARFEKNMRRHEGIAWSDVRAKLDGHLAQPRTVVLRCQRLSRVTSSVSTRPNGIHDDPVTPRSQPVT
jgi:hypothetical protein